MPVPVSDRTVEMALKLWIHDSAALRALVLHYLEDVVSSSDTSTIDEGRISDLEGTIEHAVVTILDTHGSLFWPRNVQDRAHLRQPNNAGTYWRTKGNRTQGPVYELHGRTDNTLTKKLTRKYNRPLPEREIVACSKLGEVLKCYIKALLRRGRRGARQSAATVAQLVGRIMAAVPVVAILQQTLVPTPLAAVQPLPQQPAPPAIYVPAQSLQQHQAPHPMPAPTTYAASYPTTAPTPSWTYGAFAPGSATSTNAGLPAGLTTAAPVSHTSPSGPATLPSNKQVSRGDAATQPQVKRAVYSEEGLGAALQAEINAMLAPPTSSVQAAKAVETVPADESDIVATKESTSASAHAPIDFMSGPAGDSDIIASTESTSASGKPLAEVPSGTGTTESLSAAQAPRSPGSQNRHTAEDLYSSTPSRKTSKTTTEEDTISATTGNDLATASEVSSNTSSALVESSHLDSPTIKRKTDDAASPSLEEADKSTASKKVKHSTEAVGEESAFDQENPASSLSHAHSPSDKRQTDDASSPGHEDAVKPGTPKEFKHTEAAAGQESAIGKEASPPSQATAATHPYKCPGVGCKYSTEGLAKKDHLVKHWKTKAHKTEPALLFCKSFACYFATPYQDTMQAHTASEHAPATGGLHGAVWVCPEKECAQRRNGFSTKSGLKHHHAVTHGQLVKRCWCDAADCAFFAETSEDIHIHVLDQHR